jgi:hypothetical protein
LLEGEEGNGESAEGDGTSKRLLVAGELEGKGGGSLAKNRSSRSRCIDPACRPSIDTDLRGGRTTKRAPTARRT